MPRKSRGSAYLTAGEAAKVLGVSAVQLHRLCRDQLLEGSYPEGRRAGKRFRAEEVLVLKELRRDARTGGAMKLLHLAMRAIVTSRRAERMVQEMAFYLGLDAPALPTDPASVAATHARVEGWLYARDPNDRAEIRALTRILLAIGPEHLGLIARHAKAREPGRTYAELGAALAEAVEPGDDFRTHIEHARRSLRNAAYLYLRGAVGERRADAAFPGERYTDRLLRMRPR